MHPAPLPAPPPFQLFIDGVEYLELPQRPEGGDQMVPVAVTGEALDDDLWIEPLQIVTDKPHICVPIHDLYFSQPIVVGQLCITHDMEQMDFHPIHPDPVEDGGAAQHLLAALAGEAEYDMGADPDLPGLDPSTARAKAA